MAEKGEGSESTDGGAVTIGYPKEPRFNVERESKWLHEEMMKTGEAAKAALDEETEWQQKHLDKIHDPLREVAGKGRKASEVSRPRLDELDCDKIASEMDDEARALFGEDLRSKVSPRIGSCVPAFSPYPADYNDLNSGGIGGMHSHLNASTGRFGGYTFLAVGGSQWLGTGVGEWVNSGANSGVASVRADITVSGRCVEYSALFGYFRNIVRVHVRTWDSSGRQFDSRRTVHDNWEVIGLNVRDFSNTSFTPTVFVPIEPHRWYLVWAWAEQYTVCGGVADGGTHLWMRANRLEICV
jgi:hypothetical protein